MWEEKLLDNFCWKLYNTAIKAGIIFVILEISVYFDGIRCC